MYNHLTYENLVQIQAYLHITHSRTKIGKFIWCNKSTISRLLAPFKHNYDLFDPEYERQQRQEARYKANQQFHKLKAWDSLTEYILKQIKSYRSPEEISWRYELDHGIYISPQTIYDYIYEHYPEFIVKYFRRRWKKYKYWTIPAKHIPNRKWIEQRPEAANNRERLWDFEWDTICGKWHKQRIVTYADRKSWYLLAKKLKSVIWMAWELTISSRELFWTIPAHKKHTVTDDNGVEFVDHEEFTRQSWVAVYFANKYRPRERWTNEYTNWLIRQFLPKWHDFDTVTDWQLEEIVEIINTRPRKKLWRKTPKEVFRWDG